MAENTFKVGDKCVIIPGHGLPDDSDPIGKIVTIISLTSEAYDYKIEPNRGFSQGIKKGNLRKLTKLEKALS